MDQVQIPIERNDDSWRQRCNDRVERLKQYPSCQEELVGGKYSMIFDLEKEIQNGNVDSFVDVLEQESLARKLHLSLIFYQVTRSDDSLLHEAAYFGREKIAELIGHHFPELLTKTNIKGDTALHVAAGAKSSDVIKLIISQYKAQSKDSKLTRLVNEYGNTPLHEAVSSNYLDGVTTLFHADKSVAYYLNKSGKSPLYLAVLTGNRKMVDLLLDAPFPDKTLPGCHGNSPLHAAIYAENAGLIEEIVAKKSKLMHSRDEDGGTPLHYAATRGYVKGVCILLSKSGLSTALEWNAKGHLPIHLACKWGHVKVVKEFLEQERLNSRVLLNEKGQNILHIAAKNGRDNVVKYLLRNTKLKQQQIKLVNEKDKDGNTPLHLASQNFYPNVLFSLSRDESINVNVMNNEGLTPRDIILGRPKDRTVARRQLLSNVVLHSVGAKISDKSRSIFLERKVSRKQDWIKDRANTLLLVAMLIVTVTFAAGFTVPGGVYSSDDPNPHNRGMPVLDKRSTFQIFVLFNTVAMYSSSFGCFLLLWTLGDFHFAVRCYTSAIIMVCVALATMTLAFTAAVGLFVSNVSWLATVITIIGIIFLSLTFSMTFLLRVFPHGVGIPFTHPVSELLIWMSISVYGSPPKIKKPSASQQERQE